MKMNIVALWVFCFVLWSAGFVLADSRGLTGMLKQTGDAAVEQAVSGKATETQEAAGAVEAGVEEGKAAASDAARTAEEPAAANWSDNPLVSSLVKDTGVKPEQAAGGAGSIFQFAKSKMSADDFGQVAGAVPNMTGLLGAAPSGGAGGLVGAASSALGGSGGTLGGLAALAGPFSQLGLSSDMIGQFIPVILNFVQSQGGSSVSNSLSSVLQP